MADGGDGRGECSTKCNREGNCPGGECRRGMCPDPTPSAASMMRVDKHDFTKCMLNNPVPV